MKINSSPETNGFLYKGIQGKHILPSHTKYNKVTLDIPQSTPVEHIFVGNVSAMYLSKGCRSLTGLQARRFNAFLKNRGGFKSHGFQITYLFSQNTSNNKIENFGFFFQSQVLIQTAYARKFVFTRITVKNLNFLFHVLLKCFFTLGNLFLHFSQLKTWVSCFMFLPLCFSRFQGAANSFSHVSHWNRIWKHWLRKTKCIAQDFSTTIIHISQEIFMS